MKHDTLHNQRRGPDSVETVTTVFYQTIVWVDKNGKVVSTETHAPPPQAAIAHAQTTSADTPKSSPAFAGFGAQQPKPKPQSTPDLPQSNSPIPSLSVQTNSPDNAKPTVSSVPNDSQSGDTKGSSNAPGGMGICYDMINSQTQCKSRDTANQEFSFLKSQGYGMVRVYDIGCPLGDFTAAAAQNGLKLMVGINQIANLNGDLNKLIGMINGDWSTVDTVYIGNELVNSGAASAGDVASAVSTARGILSGAGYHGNVITVDTFNVMQRDGTVCSTSDYCGTNIHAFFDPNTAAASAGNFVLNAYNNVIRANNGKRVVVTESGWPWQGSCNGNACPSPQNQKTAMNSIMTSFSGMPGSMFMFQAYNAGYKTPGAQGVEQFFGIYDSDHYAGGIGPQ